MFPYINLFNKKIGTYAIFAVLGILSAGFYCCKIANKKKIDSNDLITFLLVCMIGVFIGGHLLYGIVNYKLLFHFITHLDKINNISLFLSCVVEIFGGSVFYGGLLGGILTGLIYGKIKKVKLLEYSDLITPAIPLFHFFGRIGCFFAGCCYGIESKFGIYYDNSYYINIKPKLRFPIQLVESGYNLILFIFLYFLYKKGKLKGNLIYIYLILYSLARFIFEFYRGDYYRGFIFGFSTSQIISICILIYCVIHFIIIKIKSKK